MENQMMQDAPPIRNLPGFSTENAQAFSSPNQKQQAAVAQSAKANTIVAPMASLQAIANDTTAAPADRAPTDSPASPTQLSRDQILDTTWQCLCEKGYDATTIRQIASRLDCAIGSIYRYYRDKHDLLSCVTQRPFEAVAQAIESGESFPDTARMYVTLAAGETQSYMLMFWLANQKRKNDHATQATVQLPQVIDRIIQGWGKQTGTREAALARWAIMHGGVTAGADVMAMLNDMGLMESPSTMPVSSARPAVEDSDLPHDRTALQIVTVMRTPPSPRKNKQSLSKHTSSNSAVLHESGVIKVQQEDTHEVAEPVRQKEDVCLL